MKLKAEPYNQLSTFASNLNIVNFNNDGNACKNNYIFQQKDDSHDSASVLTLQNIVLTETDYDHLIMFQDPNPNLATFDKGCGSLVCTGKRNIIINDLDNSN